MIELSFDEVARQFGRLHNQLMEGELSQTAMVIEDGKPVLAVIPWQLYEALLETAQTPTDPRVLLGASPELRARALAIAAARAEQEYRTNPELTNFEAFGEDDLFDATE